MVDFREKRRAKRILGNDWRTDVCKIKEKAQEDTKKCSKKRRIFSADNSLILSR